MKTKGKVYKEITSSWRLKRAIKRARKRKKPLKNISLVHMQGQMLEEIDFSGIDLIDVNFSGLVLKKCKFAKATIDHCCFSNVNEDIDCVSGKDSDCQQNQYKRIFNNGILIDCTFKEAKISKSLFREALMIGTDFRYAELTNCTLESSGILFSDFYRCFFKEINVFLNTHFVLCSLHQTFFDSSCITMENLESFKTFKKNYTNYYPCRYTKRRISRILEEDRYKISELDTDALIIAEDPELFRHFLKKRFNDEFGHSATHEAKVEECYAEAARIYRALSALWESKGYFKDCNQAFLKAKVQEVRQKRLDFKQKKSFGSFFVWLGDWLLYWLTGYGTKLRHPIVWYLSLCIIFGVVYTIMACLKFCSNLIPFLVSFRNSVCLQNMNDFIVSLDCRGGSNSLSTIRLHWIEAVAYLQSGLSLLLLGFLGFVIANKLRKS